MNHEQDVRFMRHHRSMRNVLVVAAVAAVCFYLLVHS